MAWALRSQLGKVCVVPSIPGRTGRGASWVVWSSPRPPSGGRHLQESVVEAGGVVTLRMPIWTGFLPACTRCEEGEVKVK